MAGIRSLGGLSPFELLKRTVRESWEDDVFGQAGRLAFYHFITLFPALLLILMPLAQMEESGASMRETLNGLWQRFLPTPAASLVTNAIRDLNANAHQGGALLFIAIASAIWAGINGSWAMIVGLNTAYETQEDRRWWQIARVAAGLMLAMVALVLAALVVAYYAGGQRPWTAVRFVDQVGAWAATSVGLLVCFGLFYRFGPNLKRREWRWSLPGAVFGAALWLAATVLVRLYFNRISTYPRIYGPAAASAMLLMWLYMTSAMVLIGAEMNSEIEKAREQRGAEPPERYKRESRPPRR